MPKLRNCTPRNVSDSLDLFSRPVYSFTFKSSPVMSTWPGVCCSLALAVTLLLFTLAKV